MNDYVTCHTAATTRNFGL